MKFSVDSKELLKKIELANLAISSNPVLPILEGCLLTLKDGVLNIRATNLETTIETSMGVNQSQEGETTISANTLINLLKAIPPQPIQFNVIDNTRNIEITSATGKYNIQGEDPSEFPSSPEPSTNKTIGIEGATLQSILENTIFACSSDELRPAMTGVYFLVENREITAVATNAHILSKCTIPTSLETEESFSFIVNSKVLGIVSKLNMQDVQLSVGKVNAVFASENTKVTVRLIDARYPDYNAVIPVNNPLGVSFDRSEMIGALKRLLVVSNITTSQGVFEIDGHQVIIKAQDLDFNKGGNESVLCDWSGIGSFKIGFNIKMVIKTLNAISSDSVTLELSKPGRAGIFRPSNGEETDGSSMIVLVMPVMLNQ